MAELVRIELKSAADAAAAALRLSAATTAAALPAHARARILSAAATTLAGEGESIARLITAEVRKPIKDARREVARAEFNLRWAAEESRRIGGEYVPLDVEPGMEGRYAVVRRFPRGPALLITPFDSPLNLAVHKVAPAIAAGLPFALKPDPRARRTAEALLRILVDAGWPPEAAQLLGGELPAVEALAADPRIRILSLTGSTAAGSPRRGSAGVFVAADADLPWAAARCAAGAYAFSGQASISVQRIFVERPVHEEFRRLLVANVRELKAGEPEDEATDVGPMIDEAAAVRVESWLKDAVAAGAKLWAGGPRRGAFLPPALIENVPADSPLAREETFGPVATLAAVDGRERALDMIADSQYGLQAGIFTNDFSFVDRAFERLPVGGLIVNDVPSLVGQEGIRSAILEYTQTRTLAVRRNL